ncbi:MAG: protein kinase [Polyangiales bacterium]
MSEDAGNDTRDRARVADRYQIEALLGQGGMAVVHAARDRATGQRVALKRMRMSAKPENQEKYLALFEREYLTLVQLSHPRIVGVYDYGVDDEGPYYTMELLDGGDLLNLAPVDWKKACSYARDVCSALALLHSRRMVHRDLSPQNVRCTSDGLAKLIDFGAMTPFGSCRDLVGTLPYVPPEAVHQQPLDARTDLYALGATLYYTLVQRHAYPARDVNQLRDFWRSRPRRASELSAGVPEALDQLITDLMQLDPAARPANAAEVMARLGAIAGLRGSEQVLVSQAYLSNPTLVGRTALLTQARKQMLRAVGGRGVALMVRSGPGLGRSRFLDACVLEGKLAGLAVLRADAADALAGSYGVARVLAKQLFDALGPVALELAEPFLPLLGHALPALVQERPDVTLERAEEPEQHHRRVQQALRHFFIEVARKRALLIAIDDLPRIDESSAAFVALLAQELADSGIVIVTTISDEDVRWSPLRGAVDLLASSSTAFELAPLDLTLTEQLLSSVFGEVPNVMGLARYVQGITAGNPRDVMRLAQHMVTEGVVRYQAGQWSLPARLETSSLPASMADALARRVAHLGEAARALALPFALECELTFTFAECGTLADSPSAALLMQTLDELVTAEVLAYAGERYGLRQRGWVAPLVAASAADETASVHLALAELFAQRGEQFRAAQHLLKGGALESGLDLLLEHAAQSELRTDVDVRAFNELLSSLPRDWLSTYELALRLIGELGRPAVQRDVLQSRLSGLIAHAVSETDGYHHIAARLAQLRHDSGLDLFAAQPADLDPGARLKKSLEEATIRWHKTPPNERVLDPGTAIKQLPKTVLGALGTIAFTCSYEACQKLPSLAPLAPLAPALAVVQHLADGVRARVAGRAEEAIAKYEALLTRIGQPDRAGLTPVHHLATQARVILSIGTLEAAMGRRSCLTRVEQLERETPFGPQAMFVRHIYHVWQGNTDEAARCKQQIELVRIESNAQYGFEGQHLLSELTAYALAEEMTLVQRATDAIAPRAAIHRAWEPVLHYGRGEYLRLSGDHTGALRELEQALAGMRDGHHQVWASAAGAHLRTLLALGRAEQACELGHAYLETASRNGLGYLRNQLRMPLALALSKTGAHEEAVALAQLVIDELLALASTGLNLAAAYETRARIDLDRGDRASFERYATLCAEQSRAGERRLVGAKYQRLVRHGSEADPSVLDDVPEVPQFTSTLTNCHSAGDRARCGLAWLARHSGATGGVLYTHTVLGLVRSATFGDIELGPSLDDWARDYFARELEQEVDATAGLSLPPAPKLPEPRGGSTMRHVPVLLTHQSERGYAITGVALLLLAADAAFVYPSRIAAELSRGVAQAGDVVTMYG